MKTWLKGGLIGVGVGIISYFAFYVAILLGIDTLLLGTNFLRFIYFFFSPVCNIMVWLNLAVEFEMPVCYIFYGLPFNIIFYAIVGALIGLIIQKRRENKK